MFGQTLVSPSPARNLRYDRAGEDPKEITPLKIDFGQSHVDLPFTEESLTYSEDSCNALVLHSWQHASDNNNPPGKSALGISDALCRYGAAFVPPPPSIVFDTCRFQTTVDGYVCSRAPPTGILAYTRLFYSKHLWKQAIATLGASTCVTHDAYAHKIFRCNDKMIIRDLKNKGMDFLCIGYPEQMDDGRTLVRSDIEKAVAQLRQLIDDAVTPPFNACYKTSFGYIVDAIKDIDEATLLSLNDTIDFSNIFYIEVTASKAEFDVYGALLSSMNDFYDTDVSFQVWVFMDTKQEFDKLVVFSVRYVDGVITEWEHTKFPNTILPSWPCMDGYKANNWLLSKVENSYKMDVLQEMFAQGEVYGRIGDN